MAVFEYKGLDGAGRLNTEITDADPPGLARAKLRKSRIFPIQSLSDRYTRKMTEE